MGMLRSGVVYEGKGTFWGRITRVVAAVISLGKGVTFRNMRDCPWRRRSFHASQARSLLSLWNRLVWALCLARCASKVPSSRW